MYPGDEASARVPMYSCKFFSVILPVHLCDVVRWKECYQRDNTPLRAAKVPRYWRTSLMIFFYDQVTFCLSVNRLYEYAWVCVGVQLRPLERAPKPRNSTTGIYTALNEHFSSSDSPFSYAAPPCVFALCCTLCQFALERRVGPAVYLGMWNHNSYRALKANIDPVLLYCIFILH